MWLRGSVNQVGGEEERMCAFGFGVGDVRAREVCLDLEKRDIISVERRYAEIAKFLPSVKQVEI